MGGKGVNDLVTKARSQHLIIKSITMGKGKGYRKLTKKCDVIFGQPIGRPQYCYDKWQSVTSLPYDPRYLNRVLPDDTWACCEFSNNLRSFDIFVFDISFANKFQVEDSECDAGNGLHCDWHIHRSDIFLSCPRTGNAGCSACLKMRGHSKNTWHLFDTLTTPSCDMFHFLLLIFLFV